MLTRHAAAAREIRKELKIHFPNIKFSVTAKNHSGGNTVYVNYDYSPNAPIIESVHGIVTDKYQKGHFDGMTDTYEYSNKIPHLPQVNYVIVQCYKP